MALENAFRRRAVALTAATLFVDYARALKDEQPAVGRDGSQRRQSIVLALAPAIFDRNVLALDIATFAQAPTGMLPYSMQRPQAIDYREFRSPTSAPRAP